VRVTVVPTKDGEFEAPPDVLEARLRKAFEVAAREIGCDVRCGEHFYKAAPVRDPAGGEMDVVAALSERMVRSYDQRIRRMLADLKALGDDAEG
jgi:hypothetical protein